MKHFQKWSNLPNHPNKITLTAHLKGEKLHEKKKLSLASFFLFCTLSFASPITAYFDGRSQGSHAVDCLYRAMCGWVGVEKGS